MTCARHFDYQINNVLRKFLLSSAKPIGKISDWYYRVEYQQRGSPHIHMLLWLEGAPVFGVDHDNLVTSFVDNLITCHNPSEDPELLKLVNRQIHRHSHTCQKKSKHECRFNYPQPPIRATGILYPLHSSIPQSEVLRYKETWSNIKKKLNDLKGGENISFNQFLAHFNVTEENYLLAVRSSLNTPTIFLKRNPNELRINNYNPACLLAWRANMDIQYVLDVYACAMYIVSYMSKAQKGMSELLRQACEEARKGNATIKQQVRDIGTKFLNSVEISAQEAVYILSQLPMKKSSREVVFVNTNPPEERVKLLKPMDDTKKLQDDSEGIYTTGLIKRYTTLPPHLEQCSLADYAAWYDSSEQYVKQSIQTDTDNLPLETGNNDENDDDSEINNNLSHEQNLNCKKIKKRLKARIIKSVWFNKDKRPSKALP